MAARSDHSISLDEARRIALAAQGFDRPRPQRATMGHVRDAVRRVATLQLDFVNALVPAHHLVIFSRV
ncbi:MAG: winged helix-turn-helix domain-containing protein, partial [Gemmatimonadota bacterium]|nr:winged helix-turn-helix domain-containing protein [Gemmatimonadota bacterium]